MPQTQTDLSHVNTVMVPVTDQGRALAFYTERLGFETRFDAAFGEGAGERWVEVAPPGATTSIALTPERGDDWRAGRMTGVSFLTADIDATHAQLREAGVDVDAEVLRMDGPPPPMFWMRDLDGNVLLVVEG